MYEWISAQQGISLWSYSKSEFCDNDYYSDGYDNYVCEWAHYYDDSDTEMENELTYNEEEHDTDYELMGNHCHNNYNESDAKEEGSYGAVQYMYLTYKHNCFKAEVFTSQ